MRCGKVGKRHPPWRVAWPNAPEKQLEIEVYAKIKSGPDKSTFICIDEKHQNKSFSAGIVCIKMIKHKNTTFTYLSLNFTPVET